MKSLIFLLIVEFQWFLIALSVLPGRNFAMMAHLFPRLHDDRLQAVSLHDGDVFFFCPSLLLDVRIEMVVPPFTALFANSTMKVLGDKGPILRTKLHDHLFDNLILFCGPRSLD
jgi:hypothetical protein